MKFFLLVLDVLFIILSGYSILEFSGKFYVENLEAFKNIWIFIVIYKIFFNYFFDLYSFENKSDGMFIFIKAFQSAVSSFIIIVFTTFYLRNFALPRSFMGITAFLDIIYIYISRSMINSRVSENNILVVTESKEKFEFIRDELSYYNSELNIEKGENDFSVLKEVIKKHTFEKIIFSSGVFSDFASIIRLLWYANKNSVKLALFPGFAESFVSRVDFLDVNGLPLIKIGNGGFKLWVRLIKRLLDIIISLCILIVFLPLLPFIAFIIKYDSEGPVFFTQERIGYKGKVFKLVKLRTMINDAESKTGPVFAKNNDSRITKIGKFLRKFRLDELPQFINVLMGTMSVVGPRPERDVFVKKFYTKLPGYFIRTEVKPGITGLAQIYGGYHTKPEEKLKFDFIYINNYSLFMDVKIIFLTILHTMKAKGV